jgi:Holliday junction resolvase RusA-like endonuclease
MFDIKLDIKPLSVNKAWQGKRFKSRDYDAYEKTMLLLLPKLTMPEPPYRLFYEFGFSNTQSDYDNPCKPLGDILQKKYGFNDKEIYEAHIRKRIVKKGQEYIRIRFEHIDIEDYGNIKSKRKKSVKQAQAKG